MGLFIGLRKIFMPASEEPAPPLCWYEAPACLVYFRSVAVAGTTRVSPYKQNKKRKPPFSIFS